MRLTEVDFDGRVPIDGYGPGFFRIEDKIVEGHVLMGDQGMVMWDGLSDVAAVIREMAGHDVVFIGMGAEIAHLPAEFAAQLKEAGVAYEIMGTAAACRTYNVLISEGRQIGAALLTV